MPPARDTRAFVVGALHHPPRSPRAADAPRTRLNAPRTRRGRV